MKKIIGGCPSAMMGESEDENFEGERIDIAVTARQTSVFQITKKCSKLYATREMGLFPILRFTPHSGGR